MIANSKLVILLLAIACTQAAQIQNKYAHKISHPAPKKYQENQEVSFDGSAPGAGAESIVAASGPGGGNEAVSSAAYAQEQAGGAGFAEDDKKDYYAEPKYKFKYGVNDPHSKDYKVQEEHRDGEHTNGQYSLVEPDGSVLTVEYSVIGKSGFNAKVHRTGNSQNNL